MLRLPGKTPLPAAAAGRLEKADCCRLLQVPGAAAGERHAFLCPSLTSLNGVTLALSLPQERTELGRGLVRGLWFDQPLTLWLCGAGTTLRARAWAYRCHIAGPVFTRLLARANRRTPSATSPAPGSCWRRSGGRRGSSLRPPSCCRTARRSCTWITRCCTQTDEDSPPPRLWRGGGLCVRVRYRGAAWRPHSPDRPDGWPSSRAAGCKPRPRSPAETACPPAGCSPC